MGPTHRQAWHRSAGAALSGRATATATALARGTSAITGPPPSPPRLAPPGRGPARAQSAPSRRVPGPAARCRAAASRRQVRRRACVRHARDSVAPTGVTSKRVSRYRTQEVCPWNGPKLLQISGEADFVPRVRRTEGQRTPRARAVQFSVCRGEDDGLRGLEQIQLIELPTDVEGFRMPAHGQCR